MSRWWRQPATDGKHGAPEPTAASRWWRVGADDLGHPLGFFGRGVWGLYGLFAVVIAYQALVLGGPAERQPLTVFALALAVSAGPLVTMRAPTPLPRRLAWTVVGVVVVVTVIVTWTQPFHDRPPVYTAWELGADNALLFCLTIRGRTGIAWVAEGLSLALIALWSTLVTGSPLYGIGFSWTQATTLLACSVFAVGLHRTARAIAAYRESARIRADQEARAAVAAEGAVAALDAIRRLALKPLRAIASGGRPAPLEVRVAEAAIRDLLRGRSLARPPLVDALRDLRLRGVDVSLLDDTVPSNDAAPGEDASPTLDAAAAWVVHAIDGLEATEVTIRIAHGGRLTIAADGELLAERSVR
ncbi:hypothetical protein [Curtobacterium ammoniigenes]|uniref:hypothetical protein n=1 Tax=Curtobacterium ammoniigenes TaxID=395387 RepID=UPI000B26BBC7|nr:hypothetical protein [Curtobacterium ammoniigenes]